MTEAAIDSGGAAASAVPVETVLTPETTTHNNPIQATMPEVQAPAAEKKAPSASEAIKAAQEKLTKEADPKATRDEGGKFTPKEAKQEPVKAEAEAKAKGAPEQTADASQSERRASRYEAPARFNDQGKAEWASAPESVQAEVHRTIKNLEDGYAKHKESADRYEKFRSYDDTAKTNGRDLSESLAKVVEVERVMKQNVFAGVNFMLREIGPRGPDGNPITIDDLVSHVAGQSNDQRLAQAHARIQELEAIIEGKDREAKIPSIVEEFAKSHPRFDELKPAMIPLIKAGHTLETAYELADALKPVSDTSSVKETQTTQASSAAEAASPAPARPNPAGQKSISGAPSSGATSGGKKRILSNSEAIKAAMARA